MSTSRLLRRSLAVIVPAAFVVSAGCSNPDESPTAGPDSPVGTTVVADGLVGPTQIAEGPEGRMLVAQLNGPEGEANGQVLEVDVESGERRVLLDGLDTPTGVLWLDDRLWVMERRSLASSDWDGTGDPGPKVVLMDELPFNGRSEGTLTALSDGRILYETSGSVRGGEVVDGSGILWSLDPATGESEPFATGLKNAYAHATLADGSVLVTEVGDNVADPPPDELHLFPGVDGSPLDPGVVPDGGWPDCPPPRQCARVTGPLATFPAGATPTGVAVVDDRALVALFVTGSIVRVDLAGQAQGEEPVAATTELEGLDGPHTVLAREDGKLWVSEHGAGRVVSFEP